MKKYVLILILILLVSTPSFAAKWLTLPATDIQSKCPPNNWGGITYAWTSSCSAVVAAWSGAVWDDANRAMYVWGGGHGDYSGNEVYKLDISLSTGVTMTRWKDPDTTFTIPRAWGGDEVCDGCSNPCSRHTYGNMAFIPAASSGLAHDQLWIFGGAKAGGSGGFGTDTWMLDLTTKIWTKKNPTGPNPGSVILWAVYHPGNNKVYAINGGSGSNSTFSAYDVATNTWARLRIFTQQLATGDSSYRNATIVGDDYYFLGGNGTSMGGLWKINVDGSPDYEYHAVSTTGDKQIEYAMAPGLTYDSKRNLLVAWNGGSSSAGNYTEPAAIYTLNLSTFIWTKTTVTENAPILATPVPHGVFGRFAYSSKMDCYVVIGQAGINASLFCPDDYPTDLWFSRSLAGSAGANGCENGLCKHVAVAQTPDGLLWFFGGDRQTGSAQNWIHNYDVSSNTWTLKQNKCPSTPTVMLDAMDEGFATYNSTDGKIYYNYASSYPSMCRIGPNGNHPEDYVYDPNCTYGYCNNPLMYTDSMMRYNPTTATWDSTQLTSVWLSFVSFSYFDALTNKFYQFNEGSRDGVWLRRYDIPTNTWTNTGYLAGQSIDLVDETSESSGAWDSENRIGYIWDPCNRSAGACNASVGRLFKYNVATNTMSLDDSNAPIKTEPTLDWRPYKLSWDSANNIVLAVDSTDLDLGKWPMKFHSYNPATKIWQKNMSKNSWNAKQPFGRHSWYDSTHKLLIIFGYSHNDTDGTNQMWFYRYGGGAGISHDMIPPVAPNNLKVN